MMRNAVLATLAAAASATVGFCNDKDRSCAACGTPARVCLDGAPVKLLGFCMHNLDAHYRHTVPRESIKKDLEQVASTLS